MFSNIVMEKIFSRNELQDLPLNKQSEVIHAIEEVLEEEEESNATVSDNAELW